MVTYSLHKIANPEGFGFDPSSYSRFKFGDEQVAKEFGKSLAKGFINDYLSVCKINEQIVVLSSPYSFIPTATFAMKTYFVFALNEWLVENGFNVIQEAKVHRTITYKEDYGELNAEQRLSLISNDSFHIDEKFIEGKSLIFLDDIRITGSHERMIVNMVDKYRLKNAVYMLYFAELINKNIHPKVENYLNYYSVKSIYDLRPIIHSRFFQINTRIVKYILNSDPIDFKEFIWTESSEFKQLLYNMAIGNGYHTIDAYTANLNFLKRNCINKNIQILQYGN